MSVGRPEALFNPGAAPVVEIEKVLFVNNILLKTRNDFTLKIALRFSLCLYQLSNALKYLRFNF